MFNARSSQSIKFKALFDLLFQNATTACLTIDADGIRSENVTSQDTVIKAEIPASAFDEYSFTFDKPQYIGLGSHINHFFKSVKNKTNIRFSIDKPFVLDIEIISSFDCSVALAANIENVQNVAAVDVCPYDTPPVTVLNTSFGQVCKSFKQPHVDVTKRDGQISFSFGIPNISTKTITFGKKNVDDKTLFYKTFRADQFIRIAKIASFADEYVNLYVENDKPLMLSASCDIGEIKIIVKHHDV